MRRRSIEPKPERPEPPNVLLPVVLIPSVVGLLLHHLPSLLLLIFRKLLVDLTHSCRRLDLPVFAFPVGSQATGEPLAQICHFLPVRKINRRSKIKCKCNCKCNLFTHEAPRSSQELVQKCPCIPASNWNLEMLVFEERGKPEYPEKNLSEQRREPTTNSTHI